MAEQAQELMNRKAAEMGKVTGAQEPAKPNARGQAAAPALQMANPGMQMAAAGVKAGIGKG